MSGCGTGGAREIGQGLVTPEFVTVTMQQGNQLNNVDRDILVQFQKAHKFFMLVSMTQFFAGSDVFLHFSPLGYPVANGSNTISPTGGEPWIPLANLANSAGRAEGRWIKFNVPVSRFYIDVDHKAGQSATPYLITFMGADEIDGALAERQ